MGLGDWEAQGPWHMEHRVKGEGHRAKRKEY